MADPITIYFELDEGVDIEDIKSRVAKGLADMEAVEESDVQQTNLRMPGIEIAAAIGAAVVVLQSAKGAIAVATELVEGLTKLVQSIKGLKSAIVETPSGPVKLEDDAEVAIAALLGR